MAESACSVMSNSVNTQNQVSCAVQRSNQTEESEKTDQGRKIKHNLKISTNRCVDFGRKKTQKTSKLRYFEREKCPAAVSGEKIALFCRFVVFFAGDTK